MRWLHRTCVCVSSNVVALCEALPGKGDVMGLRQINQSATLYQLEMVCVCLRVLRQRDGATPTQSCDICSVFFFLPEMLAFFYISARHMSTASLFIASSSLCFCLQLLGAAFLSIGLWAWAEKVSLKHMYAEMYCV